MGQVPSVGAAIPLSSIILDLPDLCITQIANVLSPCSQMRSFAIPPCRVGYRPKFHLRAEPYENYVFTGMVLCNEVK